jgi:hypothetical protein
VGREGRGSRGGKTERDEWGREGRRNREGIGNLPAHFLEASAAYDNGFGFNVMLAVLP